MPNNEPNYGAGSIVTASALRLHVQGGDSWKPLTRVRLELSEECLQSSTAPLEADGPGPTTAGCSSTSASLTPMLAVLAVLFFLRRPAAIRLVSRQERRRVQR
jgi:hypothetical protein